MINPPLENGYRQPATTGTSIHHYSPLLRCAKFLTAMDETSFHPVAQLQPDLNASHNVNQILSPSLSNYKV